MLGGEPIAKGNFVKAIILKGKVSYLKDISFMPNTLVFEELSCNIIQHIIFFKHKIFWDGVVEILTDHPGENS